MLLSSSNGEKSFLDYKKRRGKKWKRKNNRMDRRMGIKEKERNSLYLNEKWYKKIEIIIYFVCLFVIVRA